MQCLTINNVQNSIPLNVNSMVETNPSDGWSTDLSPYQYELVPLPSSAQKCYGCSAFFTDMYRQYPYNFVIRHPDCHIQGRTGDRHLSYSPNFQWTYYHLNIEHIARKNPLFAANPIVYCSMHNFVVATNDPQYLQILEQSRIQLLPY